MPGEVKQICHEAFKTNNERLMIAQIFHGINDQKQYIEKYNHIMSIILLCKYLLVYKLEHI